MKVTSANADARDYQLVARHSGKCADIAGISTTNGAKAHQWSCVAASQQAPGNQTFRLTGKI